MAPKKGIVRSGNAGNSSKASAAKPKNNDWKKAADVYAEPVKEAPKLFPDGYKFPLSLLQERCQKNGWKANVTTRQVGEGQFAFAATLSRTVQKSSGQETESVRLEPHPPYLCPSAIEARHWGATYALYRVWNGIQLDRVLPPAPRDYWRTLAAEHKSIEEHQKWMYDPDPFAARQVVNDRQAKSAQKKEDVKSGKSAELNAAREFADEMEVKMSGELRDVVEAAIQQEIANHPESEPDDSLVLSEALAPDLTKQLQTLGFTLPQARKAISYLSTPSSFAAQLLRFSTPLSALIEYLILHVPECDLPPRFLPSNNSSNPFVMGAHGKKDDIALRWIEDRAVKLAGWPVHAVREATALPHLQSDWAALTYALNRRLIGHTEDWSDPPDESQPVDSEPEETITDEDIEAMGATWDTENSGILSMPLFSAPLTLHFVLPPSRPYDRHTRPPPMYITSPSAPAYVRLHLLACVLRAFEDGSVKEGGHGILLGAMQVVDEMWAVVEDEGPPDIAGVLQYLMPQKDAEDDEGPAENSNAPRRAARKTGRRRVDPRSDVQVKEEFEALQKTAGYKKMLAVRERLPAFRSRDEFLGMLDKSRVVVVVGETGSGKTTQLPQFVLDSLIASSTGKSANILITQPRRISAISVASRVSSERCDDGSVGYSIRGESKSSEKTKLLFCTTGVVLRRMSGGDALEDVTHVIVDEVHERSVDGDFLLLELKELLHRHKTLKVILMSATINHETFIQYFNGAPLLSIPGFTHPVKDVYLEDVWTELKYTPQAGGRGGGARGNNGGRRGREDEDDGILGVDERTASALKAVDRAERLDFGLVTAVVDHIVRKAQSGKGGILIFLPGVQEIRQCIDTLKHSLSPTGVTIFPLHANLSSDEQRAVFGSVPGWKVVVATNVAETSITIDDIVYVVDAGKVKETQFDAESGLSKLVEDWVTRAAARQRRGRAGRTQPGTCYKLYTRARDKKMHPFPKPEIQRVPLESLALHVKATKEGEDVKKFLGRAIDPPAVAAMDKALEVLQELGALDGKGKLTALGKHLAVLPLDLRLGKMLILATIFQCVDPILTVAAILSCKPIFLNPMDKRNEANAARASFATEKSDLLTDMHAYDECAKLSKESRGNREIRQFCEDNFISQSTIRDVGTLRGELYSALVSIGLVPQSSKPGNPTLNTHSTSMPLLKAILLAAFYPRISRVSLPRGALKFDQTASGAVQRENTAKEFKVFDMRRERVWIHPASILFGESSWKSGLVVSFLRVATGKLYLRDVTEVPLYALLLFGGDIQINHIGGGLRVGGREGEIKLKAWPRIGILVQQLRRLLDAQLMRTVESGSILDVGKNNPVIKAMLALLANDGLSPQNI